MFLQIVLDRPNHVYTTSEDVRGRVELWLPVPGTVMAVDVMLEGASTSKVINVKNGVKVESHMVLQQKKRLWGFYQGDANMLGHYTMAQGNYQWPFAFTFPQTAMCNETGKSATERLQSLVKGSVKHISASLPPSFAGVQEGEGIVYYTKAEVRTKDILKKDPQTWQPVHFMPTELCSPRDGRVQQIPLGAFDGNLAIRKPGPPTSVSYSDPFFRVEACLLDPPFVIRNHRLPMQVRVEQTDGSQPELFIQTLKITLVGHTETRAGSVSSSRVNTWLIAEHEDLALRLICNKDKTMIDQTEGSHYLDLKPDKYWPTLVPSDATPSFEVCNIKRWYEVRVQVDVSSSEKPSYDKVQQVVLTLPCLIYGGVGNPARQTVMSPQPLAPPLEVVHDSSVDNKKLPQSQAPPDYENPVVAEASPGCH